MALLKKLSDRNQNLLRASSYYINSFKRVVEELVYNSLDADSTSIAIRVSIDNKCIQVLDNGIGITKDNFRLLGDKYVTSKFIDVTSLKSTSNKYGYKGISLASLIEVSENVKISSKFKNSQETWMKIFCKGSVEDFNLTNPRPSKGTTVEISGFLYNLNIQQKSMDLLNEINSIKLVLEQLSLVHCNVSFSLRDDTKNEIIFKIHKNRNIYQTLWSLFEISMNDLKDLQVEKNQYKVKAYIGKSCLVLKKYQWVFFNGRFVSNTFIHLKIKENLTKKSFIITENKLKVKLTDEHNFNGKIPFYFVFLSCPNFDIDFNYNHKHTIVEFKNCDEVNKLIEKLINLYYGDIKGKPIIASKEINHGNNDTRRKVKEIMDKILNKNEVKAKTMQLQNGIIGKNIKRKVQKKLQPNVLQKQSIDIESNSFCKIKKVVNFIETAKKLDSNELSKSNKSLCNSLKNKNNNRNLLKAKNYRTQKKNIKSKIKTHASIEPLIEKFEQQTETVQRRCQKLSDEVQAIINRKYFNVLNFESPKEIKGKYIKCNIIEQLSAKQVKTTYDLLKTNDNKEMFPINVFKDTQNTVIAESIVSDKKILSTYNSHKGNNRTIPKCSIRKLNKYVPDLNPILYQYSCDTKKNQTNNRKEICLTECYNNYDSYNLHYKSNNVIRHNRTYNETVNFHNTGNYLSNKISMNNNNLNFESTFTINMSNSLYSINDGVNKTYSVKMSTNLSLSNNIKTTSSPTIDDTVTCKDTNTHEHLENDMSIFKPKSHSIEEVEPLKFCEAILNSTDMRNIAQEFDKSFFHNEKSTLITLTSDNNCTRAYNNFENFGKNELQPSMPIFSSQAHNTDDFKLKGRHRFVPKGMSQIFEGNFKRNTDYNNDEEYYEDAIYNHFADDVRDKFDIFEPCVKNVKDIISKDFNKINDRIDKDNADLIFDSESLKQAQILGQVDKKFIAARLQSRCSSDGKSSDFLTLFDQHAVDERVRLERNLSDYFDGIKWKSVAFETFQLKLIHDEFFYLYNYKDKFTQFGLQWTFAEKHVLIHAVPEAIIGKNPRKGEIIITAVKKFISEQIEIIKSIRGNVFSYPKCIMELVFSEACRYAIKFGDQLSKDECVNMIDSLAQCKTPFQCAHGRPVMAIMMEIPNNNYTYKVNLSSLKEFKKRMS